MPQKGHSPAPWIPGATQGHAIIISSPKAVCEEFGVALVYNAHVRPMNVPLICSAPDLLETCRKTDQLLCYLIEAMLNQGKWGSLLKKVKDHRAAVAAQIAKAEGTTP